MFLCEMIGFISEKHALMLDIEWYKTTKSSAATMWRRSIE